MKRWHEEINHLKKQKKLDVSLGRERSLGYYRKKHALDCGNPGCGICHNDKTPKRQLTEQEELSNISLKEQLKNVDRIDVLLEDWND